MMMVTVADSNEIGCKVQWPSKMQKVAQTCPLVVPVELNPKLSGGSNFDDENHSLELVCNQEIDVDVLAENECVLVAEQVCQEAL